MRQPASTGVCSRPTTHAMRERGVLLAPSPNELMFLSTAHGPRELELTLAAFDGTLRALRESELL
jgi:glutamate-1-semialdehyde aminotransferase